MHTLMCTVLAVYAGLSALWLLRSQRGKTYLSGCAQTLISDRDVPYRLLFRQLRCRPTTQSPAEAATDGGGRTRRWSTHSLQKRPRCEVKWLNPGSGHSVSWGDVRIETSTYLGEKCLYCAGEERDNIGTF